jgi:rhamnosyltransferase
MRFMLGELYPDKGARRLLDSTSERLRLEDMFFSNVGSAIRACVWREVPFRDRVVMSEDQYWAYDALRAGYELVYEPRAVVLHSHNYSPRTLFARNRASGASLRGLIGDSPGGIAGRGLQYLAREARYLVRTGAAGWVPYALAFEAARALGFGMGIRFGNPVMRS